MPLVVMFRPNAKLLLKLSNDSLWVEYCRTLYGIHPLPGNQGKVLLHCISTSEQLILYSVDNWDPNELMKNH